MFLFFFLLFLGGEGGVGELRKWFRMREEYFCMMKCICVCVSLPRLCFAVFGFSPSPILLLCMCFCVYCVCMHISSLKRYRKKPKPTKNELKLPSSSLHRYIATALLLMAVAHKIILISIGHR